MVRTPCCDENGRKKGTWTPEEDRKLAAYITKYGSWNCRFPKYKVLVRISAPPHNLLLPQTRDESSKKCNTNKNNKRKSSVGNQNASPNNNNMHENIVLESSQCSPKESFMKNSSYSTVDYQQKHKVYQEEALEEITSGSFWTEPFIVESFNSKIDLLAPSIDCGLVCPPSLLGFMNFFP
ncbi:hypothetical protein HAX54_039772 [Datura stramonium]|uniref:Uncharacterized protein n=1 Tax=Datura stramonium TaxID=4076 RepID=A0ABS8SJG8_DATST|nr:hypothetical protein [Datura stramonium]